MTDCPSRHIPYLSEAVARNAVTLHGLANPACRGVVWFSCGDHYHVGHPTRAIGDDCKAHAHYHGAPTL